MTFIHAPSVASLVIGAGVTLLDLNLCLRRITWDVLEDLAMYRLRGGRVIDSFEREGLVAVSRDPFGDIVKLTWRADSSTVLRTAVRLMVKDLRLPRGEPLPNMRLKLTGADRSRGSGVLRGRRATPRRRATLAPADLPPAA